MARQYSLVLLSLIVAGSAPAAFAGEYTFVLKQLTDDTLDQFDPQVSGKNATWWGQTGKTSSTRDIYFYDGSTTTNLTDGPSYEFLNQEPKISGSNVVWWGQPDGTTANQREIFYYDGKTSSRITNDTERDYPPTIDGSTAVWEHDSAASREIYRSNGLPLTADSITDLSPDVHGSRIVWVSDSSPRKVKLYNGSTTVDAGSSTFAMNKPQVSDTHVVWQGFKNSNANALGAEIYRYDGTNPTNPTNLSNNEFADFDPQISGNKVTWWGGQLGVFQVYFNDGATTTQISVTGTSNRNPMIDGNLVVWNGNDGTDDEIYLWDGTTVHQLTDNNYPDTFPKISGNHIVWSSPAGGSDGEIMSARRVLYGDANFDGIVDGGDYTIWADNYLETGSGFEAGDFNQDGVVDGGDYTLWADNYLETDPPSATAQASAVPEPTSWALGLLGAGTILVAALRRRRLYKLV